MAPLGQSRGFEELKVYANLPQRASERFPKRRDSPPPRVAPFRNNLTALSQYYNLFFLASLEKVLVYQPINQEQYLSTPIFTLELASSNSGLIGYIDPSNSHAINQLIVADLGFEEVIVAVCDDGDVAAYTTRSVKQEIENQALDAGDSPAWKSILRPFFVGNVGMSAWGVAVCKEARIIAVSSNMKTINCFAFALSNSNKDASDSEPEDHFNLCTSFPSNNQAWVQVKSHDVLNPGDRSRNLEVILLGHQTNIPNISFFNPETSSVEDDVYLVSTDIEGCTYIWNVWQRAMLVQINGPLDDIHGWSVACIDPYFCRTAQSSFELYGLDEDPHTNIRMVDITPASIQVPESKKCHFTMRPRPTHSVESDDSQDMGIDEDEDMEDEYDEDFDDVDDLGLDEHPGDDSSASEESTISQYGEESDGATQLFTHEVNVLDQTTLTGSMNTANLGSYPHEAAQQDGMISSLLPESIKTALQTRLEPAKSKDIPSVSLGKSARHFPFYVLHSTKTDIRLLHSIQLRTHTSSWHKSYRGVICRGPLHQHLHPENSWLSRLERLNIVLQVPELGLVVVGDQMGRVALLTITRYRGENIGAKNDRAGFRFDRYLPLTSQEDDNQRPKTELLGVSVGPISTQLLKRADALSGDDHGYVIRSRREAWRELANSRRYRLILYYRDHTVLSYEIGRPAKEGSDLLIV